MTLRRLLFHAGFAVLPAVFWLAAVGPGLERRAAALQRQQDAGRLHQENRMLVARRDRLREEWEAFRPLAEQGLADLNDFLNPLLLQKRVYRLAAGFHCKLRIKQEEVGPKEEVWRYSMNGSGSYEDLVRFLDALERGDHRIRFESLILAMPLDAARQGDPVSLAATFVIPVIPDLEPTATPPVASATPVSGR